MQIIKLRPQKMRNFSETDYKACDLSPYLAIAPYFNIIGEGCKGIKLWISPYHEIEDYQIDCTICKDELGLFPLCGLELEVYRQFLDSKMKYGNFDTLQVRNKKLERYFTDGKTNYLCRISFSGKYTDDGKMICGNYAVIAPINEFKNCKPYQRFLSNRNVVETFREIPMNKVYFIEVKYIEEFMKHLIYYNEPIQEYLLNPYNFSKKLY